MKPITTRSKAGQQNTLPKKKRTKRSKARKERDQKMKEKEEKKEKKGKKKMKKGKNGGKKEGSSNESGKEDQKINIKSHIEANHITSNISYSCDVCGNASRSKTGLRFHKARQHST